MKKNHELYECKVVNVSVEYVRCGEAGRRGSGASQWTGDPPLLNIANSPSDLVGAPLTITYAQLFIHQSQYITHFKLKTTGVSLHINVLFHVKFSSSANGKHDIYRQFSSYETNTCRAQINVWTPKVLEKLSEISWYIYISTLTLA